DLESGNRASWRETRMTLVAPGSDEWTAIFDVEPIGWHEYSIVAWVDRFRTWSHDLQAKTSAGQDVSVELLEGSIMLRDASRRAAASRPSPIWGSTCCICRRSIRSAAVFAKAGTTA